MQVTWGAAGSQRRAESGTGREIGTGIVRGAGQTVTGPRAQTGLVTETEMAPTPAVITIVTGAIGEHHLKPHCLGPSAGHARQLMAAVFCRAITDCV